MRILLCFVSIVVLIVASCGKKEEPNSNLSPGVIFYATGTLNGQPYKAEAGLNDYYMYSYAAVDSLNVLAFCANLKRNCTNCKEGLKIMIRNYAVGSAFSKDSSLLPSASYSYFNSLLTPTIGYRVKFNSSSTGTGTQFQSWDFGDGNFSSNPDPLHIYHKADTYMVRHTTTYSGGCNNVLRTQIDVSQKAISNKYDFTFNEIAPNSFRFIPKGVETSSLHDLVWYMGDGIMKLSSDSFVHTYSGNTIFTVKMAVLIKGTSDTLIRITKNVSSNGYAGCVSNFDYIVNPVFDSLQLSRIIIQYTDASGRVYSSRLVAQDAQSNFTINSIEEYKPNESGQRTKKIKVSFSCRLSDGFSVIELKNVVATIAIAYE